MVFTLYLKSLEIQGFKSFPTATRLAFDKPITGIVGPNGSGKSNIADAILWVMGEQSTKTLRGGKMEDVIFGGTQILKQMNFAEVSLILDNSEGRLNLDTSEVMLTRRYYRSGESEYYINRSIVRLKDMTELLMDTGLGREGYCIIGQGKIADILSSKSKDRREIFEEAAGISRYRHKKDESERKLQYTEENLVRVGDKISELELRVDPLREEAEIAKKWQLLTGELRGIEISVWLRELESASARAEKIEMDLTTSTRDIEAASQELEAHYLEEEALVLKTQGNDVEAESIRDFISGFESKHAEAESSIAVLRSQLEGNTDQIENISQELKNQDESHDTLGTQINDNNKRLGQIVENKKERVKKLDELTDQLDVISNSSGESYEKQTALLKKENDLQISYNDRKSELSALASQAQELSDMENSVQQEISATKDQFKTLDNEHKILGNELKSLQESVESLENVIKGLTIKTENRSKKTDTAGEKVESHTFEIKTMQSRQQLLQELKKEYRGYSESVKRIMQEHSRGVLKNIHGTVGELIKTDDTYTIAIETALGHALQNIIVDTVDDGKAAINFLKQREIGRATFLPISTVKGNKLNEAEFRNDDGFEGLALDLVSFDKKYNGIYTSLLGRVVIAADLNAADKIAKKHDHKYKIVTLDGQVMNPGGSMTGGAKVSTAGLLSRANELEQLEKSIKEYSSELVKLQRELSECVREKTAAEYELNTALSELRTAQEDVMKKKIEETHREQILQTLKNNINAFGTELDSLANRIKHNLNETESLKKQITALETETADIKELIEEAIHGLELLTKERERVNAARSELLTEIAVFDADSDSLVKIINDLSGIRDEMFGSRERQLGIITGLQNTNDQICKEMAEKEREAAAFIDEIDVHKARLSSLGKKKQEIEKKRNSLSRLTQELNEKRLNLEKVRSNLENRKQGILLDEKQNIDKLWDKYELTRSAAMKAGTPIESITAAQKRINTIKRDVAELGDPNIGAIKEFERVIERYEFLTSQRDDIETAKIELLNIIDKITEEMRKQFIKEFNTINESFGRTFKDLFKGGKAALVLEDPDDVLNCGIDIQVQPPGKYLKTIALLSGGEKAFVAIAIYFAILAVRPPPFVVMDEIDAALDDANALRFADYMRRMSDKTQMVVISHKRGTMEEADVLYGVTMQEHGVSSLLCVDINEAEKHMRSKVKT